MEKLIIHTDGGARGNPGPAAVGAVLSDSSGRIIKKIKKYIGTATNNQAEYQAVYQALQAAKQTEYKVLEFYLDSELVVRQLKQEYKIKNEELARIFIKIWNLLQNFSQVTFTHIPREKNKLADQLVNQAIDEQGPVNN
jgi:ribonuclease HI